ncbi:MAG: hypothetical protein ACO31E_03995 [Phycisphaerales bacterium]|jgi:hypothetical protein
MRSSMMFVAALGVAAAAQAQITLDGIADAAYGAPLAVQNTQTQFGDSNLGLIDFSNGSEIDALYARVEGGILFVMVAGNLESNFNKLEIFVDGVDGGQNQIRGDNPDVDFNGINRMGDDLATPKVVEGLTFDLAFSPDLWVSLTCGGDPFAVYMNQAELLTLGGGAGGYLGTGGAGATGATVFKSGFGFGIDNSNIAGVIGGTDIDTKSGASVLTGVEIQIPLSAIPGYVSGDVKVMAFINGGGHDFCSNQFIPGLGGGPNLGDPRFVNLDLIPGDQFVTVGGGGGGGGCPADLDFDGVVGASDLAALLNAWGGSGGAADLDLDGIVGASDLAALLNAWGNCQ